MTLRAGLLLLCCPLLGCATARVVRLDTGEGAPIVYKPARKVPPVEIDQRDFEKAMTTLLLEMKFSLSDEGHPLLRLASTTEEPGGRYHRWCFIGEAGGTRQAQGQWLDNDAAAKFLAEQRPNITRPTTVNIPEGLGRVVNPDGTFSPATQAILVPSPNGGYRTAYPIPAGHP